MIRSIGLGREGTAEAARLAARFVVLVAFLDLFIHLPLAAPFAKSVGSPVWLVGLVVAVYSVTNLAGNVGSGVLLDRWGRRGPVLVGLATTAFVLALYALVQTPGQLLAVRAAHGAAASVLAPGAFALIGDGSSSDQRARSMGVNGAIIAAAAIAGPLFAGVVRDAMGFSAVFLIDAGLMLAAFVVFFYATRQVALVRAGGASERRLKQGLLKTVLRLPLVAGYGTILASAVGLGVIVIQLPLLLSAEGEPSVRTGMIFAVYALVSLLVMASPLGRTSDRFGRSVPMAAGLALVAMALAALGAFHGIGGAAGGMVIFGLGYGFVFPASTALVAEATGVKERGTAFGVYFAVYSIGVAIGSAATGPLSNLAGGAAGLPFATAAAFPAAMGLFLIARRSATNSATATGGTES